MSVRIFDPPVILGPGLVYDRRIPETTGRAQQATLILSEMLQARFPELLRPGHDDVLEVAFDIEGGLTISNFGRKVELSPESSPQLLLAWVYNRAKEPETGGGAFRFARCIPLAGTGPWRLDALQRFFEHILVPSVSDWENCEVPENTVVPTETRFSIPDTEAGA